MNSAIQQVGVPRYARDVKNKLCHCLNLILSSEYGAERALPEARCAPALAMTALCCEDQPVKTGS